MTLHRFANIAAYLPDMAERQPESIAVHCPCGRFAPDQRYQSYTFAQLEQLSNRLAVAFTAAGIERGMRTVVMVKPGIDFFALTFALFKVGSVPVLIDPGMGIRNLKACLEEAQPQVFIGMTRAHLARHLFRWARTSLSVRVTTGRRLWFDELSLKGALAKVSAQGQFVPVVPDPDETAAILFTSGSTGVPKGVVYTHGNFLAQVRSLEEIYGIRPGEVDLPTFPLFALFAPALGMTSVLPQMDFTRPGKVDPPRIIAAIERFGVTTMFGSPALLRRVADYGLDRRVRLTTLKRVISAGAPVAAVTLERFARLLGDDASIHTPYGATEALPVSTIDSGEIIHQTRRLTEQGRGVCIGRPVAGLKVGIIRITDTPIDKLSAELLVPDGCIGEIIVSGEQVTRSYFNRPESTRHAKLVDPKSGALYHRMGDVGYRDDQGRLWFCGRKSHRVVTADETCFTIPCEGIFNTHPRVFRSALVGVNVNGRRRPLICVELEAGVRKREHKAILAQLRQLAEQQTLTEDIRIFLIHPGFPVDIRHNAKIFREKLADWAQQQISR